MSVTLRNVSGVDLFVLGKVVESEALVEVPGKVLKDSPDDAYQIGSGDDARLYPHALWSSEKEND